MIAVTAYAAAGILAVAGVTFSVFAGLVWLVTRPPPPVPPVGRRHIRDINREYPHGESW